MTSRLVWLALVAFTLHGCSDDTAAPERQVQAVGVEEARADLTASVFGDSVAPDDVVATVGEHTVAAWEVATWLDLFPTLTVEQAVADLVDAHVGSSTAQTDDIAGWSTVLLDARQSGRTIAWARRHLYPSVPEPSPADIDEVIADPRYLALFGTPALARASHVLIAPDDDATDQDRADAMSRLEALRDELLSLDEVDAHDLGAARARLEEELDGRPLDAVADLHLRFPREYSGDATWDGLAAVVPEFAEAAFDNEPGALIGPVETQFGYHLILVEGHEPADLPEGDAFRAAVRDLLVHQARSQAYGEAIAELQAAAEVYFDAENSELLWSDAETRVAAEQERHAESMTGN